MTTTQWQQIQELFEAAVDRPPQERRAFLDQACGDDPELRAEVESLLEHDEAASPVFLQPPQPRQNSQPISLPNRPDPLIGQNVGGYHIKGVIAAGGMGTVYKAVQAEPQRIVALKVMHPNAVSRSALRRFQFESQTLARLRHPNIAQVFAAGTHTPSPFQGEGRGEAPTPSPSQGEGWGEGRIAPVPYFAMEYIPDARTIIQYAREQKLPTRDRLQLFAKVCNAVHHGHQKGIIHRDLKPANILVDSAGEPKVIDFGIARATDSDIAITTQTDVGQLVGTLQYMSPEQCDADPHDLDTRSDVYTLGVLLYELLSGELPYEATGTTIYEATRRIKEDTPRRLSTINAKLRGDVETIVLKALEKDRDHRYQSAAGLAADIERHLNGEPIAAQPPGPWRRGVLWVARHPIVATSAASLTIAILTIAATVVAVWLYNLRPYEIIGYRSGVLVERHDPDRAADEVRLLSFAGRSLHKWGTSVPRGITFAEMVDRPAQLGGGKLAIIGYSASQSNPHPGCLCAFDVNGDLDTPVWNRHIKRDDIPPDLLKKGRSRQRSGVDPRGSMVADIFPEIPGREIVSVHQHGLYSQCAIRIYDLTGKLLYQVWQDGGIKSTYWMSGARLLVCLGGDERAKLNHPSYTRLSEPLAPVLFAVRPQLGMVQNGYLLNTPGDNPLSPVWYKYVLPPKMQNLKPRRMWLTLPFNTYKPARFVTLNLTFDKPAGAGLNWVIDEHGSEVTCLDEAGNEIRCTRVVSDSYKRDRASSQPSLPDPDDIHLGPLPPIEPPSTASEPPDIRR